MRDLVLGELSLFIGRRPSFCDVEGGGNHF